MNIKDHFSFLRDQTNKMASDISKKKDKTIAEVFAVAGLENPLPLCLEGRVTIVTQEGDTFEHYYLDYGKPERKRIISFEKTPELKMEHDGEVYKMVYEARYY